MENYVLLWHDSVRADGGIKAKEDTNEFFKAEGYKVIDTPYGKVAKVLYVFFVLPFIFLTIRQGNVIVQFPSGKVFLRRWILNGIKHLSGARLILVIHDIEALRLHVGKEHADENKQELEFLQMADGLISLSPKMTTWLRDRNVVAPITELNIWDYDNPQPIQPKHAYDKSLCFAGNLVKSTFLKKYALKNKLLLFGKEPQLDEYASSITYQGVFSPEELPTKLKADFGLIWDGPEVTTCSGNFGEYLKYNAPHKTSLYLSSGLPVIVWEEAAVAKVIKRYGCGLTVKSLTEVSDILDRLTPREYTELYENTVRIAKKMRHGYFMRQAIETLIKKLDDEEKNE
ncbi:beta-1,6-galactofuranosyltransferase [Ligilactobacillus faecis]|uniref:beta-1,6-galactofuranosyltransferase n=1 Tax=Ligilactobacillus faecis TaxID=762833 RepID=UPI002469C567|nr:beta-1,6-galactofuranosyltransferase [Ligilactobacillus faecis]WGN90071.1 beta-1,6-galactofuranosyltransferase [Ligilactobacillus faecis]